MPWLEGPGIGGMRTDHCASAFREATVSAGAGFVVAKTGEIMTMPGLPRVPAAVGMRVEGGRRSGFSDRRPERVQ